LAAARGQHERLWVTIDARALDGAVTGTQVHIVELIRALAESGSLRLRVLVREDRIDRATLEMLRNLAETELLDEKSVGDTTPPSTVFHRPQQAFAAEDVEIALRLGEHVVLSQLDLIAYRNPAYFTGSAAWDAYRRASRHGMTAAERVVVFSDHTRRELVSEGLVEQERIRVVAPGLDHHAPTAQRAPAALVEGGEAPFLLCLGTDFRHKNRVFALRLLASLREEHSWHGVLVLAGTHVPNGSSAALEQSFLKEHPSLRGALVELGAVSENEKAWLIANASAAVYPSVYEGFGLVPFESALSGVPCIFASQASLAETAPPGTATIVPWDASESAAAAYALLADGEARARLVELLAGAAKDLTWATAAAAMVEIYREAANAPVRAAATFSRDAVQRERELLAAHQVDVDTLIGEREMVLRDYNELLAELGPGRGLVGSEGALPEDLQHALLALASRPSLGKPLYGGLARLFGAARALRRAFSARSRNAS
jgi:glycosyltransferase involved in cell wall biosynthesis